MTDKLTFGSTFSGIGGIDLGFERAGMKAEWQVEIDTDCQGVLHRHFKVEVHEDVAKIKGKGKRKLKSADVICGGFPCQDVSVAGLRRGLAGGRSGLFWEFARILDEFEPGWFVIENVPGLLSSCGCTACVAVGRILRIHAWLRKRKKTGKCAICVAGERMLESHKGRDFALILRWLADRGYGVSWRVLDSQYFGLAQRRRRVFIVGSLGSGRSAEVLFERESLRGDIETLRQARKVTSTLPASGAGTGRPGGQGAEPGFYVEQEPKIYQWASGGGDDLKDSAQTLRAGAEVNYQFVTFQQNERDEVRLMDGDGSIAGALAAEPGAKQQNYVAEVSGTLAGEQLEKQTQGSNPNPGLMVAYSIKTAQTGSNGEGVNEEVMNTLDGANGFAVAKIVDEMQGADGALQARDGKGIGTTIDDKIVPIAWKERAGGGVGGKGFLGSDEKSFAIDAGYIQRVGVRRLTPVECERLQGFPDGWTDGQADSTRYRQLGNAVSVPVAEWIARRIIKSHAKG